MATVPKQMPLEQQRLIYEWLKDANPWLPPEDKVSTEYMTLNQSLYELATLELKLYIKIPTDPPPAFLEPFEP